MSRIGKLPVPVPDGVTVSVKRHSVAVEGPKGKIGMSFDRLVSVKLDEESRQRTVAPRRLRGAETKAARRQRHLTCDLIVISDSPLDRSRSLAHQ